MTFIYLTNVICFCLLSFNITTEAYFILKNLDHYPLLKNNKDKLKDVATLVYGVLNNEIDIIEDSSGNIETKYNIDE